MEKLITLKTSITDRQILDALAYGFAKLQRCRVCDKYAHEDEIKFVHPLAMTFQNDQERFMCSACYKLKLFQQENISEFKTLVA